MAKRISKQVETYLLSQVGKTFTTDEVTINCGLDSSNKHAVNQKLRKLHIDGYLVKPKIGHFTVTEKILGKGNNNHTLTPTPTPTPQGFSLSAQLDQIKNTQPIDIQSAMQAHADHMQQMFLIQQQNQLYYDALQHIIRVIEQLGLIEVK